MKRLLVLLFAVMMFGCAGKIKQAEIPDPIEPTYTLPEVIEHASGYTVALVMKPEDGASRPYCTGVWVEKDLILTAAHCVLSYTEAINDDLDEDEEVSPYEVRYDYIVQHEVTGWGMEPTAKHPAILKKMDMIHDLALLKASGETPTHTYAEIAESVPALGTHVVVVGHPNGMYWTAVEGTVSAVYKNLPIMKLGPWLQINGTIHFGNSGGGVFDNHGKLLGIASFKPPVPNMCEFVHRDTIAKFLGR